MNVSGMANLFHQNLGFPSRPLGQTGAAQPAGALNQLSENLLRTQEGQKDGRARFDTLELSAQAEESSPLEEMPEGLLHYYLNLCKVGANISRLQEADLMEYKQQLTAFDQTIQDYQDMLDGKAEPAWGMTQEDIAGLLERVKEARAQFLQQGAEKLNQTSAQGPTPERMLGRAYQNILGANASDGEDGPWQIDASAEDIYGEIDRALAAAHRVTGCFQKGASGLLAELKRRGCVQAGEDVSPDRQKRADSKPAETSRTSLFQELYDGLWQSFRQSTAETGTKNAGN